MLMLRRDLAQAWQGEDVFARVQAQQGQLYRALEGRRTLRFELHGQPYFLKLHQGVGWGEIFKNLIQLRWPVLGAGSEYRAIRALERLGIDTLTVAGYGRRGCNPARQLSFLITDALQQVWSLEELGEQWRQSPPPPAFKHALIARVAEVARRMHEAGINHRDFYLCHFLLPQVALGPRLVPDQPLYLMDLHRAQIRHRVPRRWRVKDLGGLYYSALDLGLTPRDMLRFVRHYQGGRLPRGRQWRLWRSARRRALRTYLRDHGRRPSCPAWTGLEPRP